MYIGASRSLIIIGNNKRDDIIPDGVETSFELSQEVPGAYEGNILVLRKRYIVKTLIDSSANISFSADTMSSSDPTTATALNEFLSPITSVRDGDVVIIENADNAGNDGEFQIKENGIVYTGDNIDIACEVSAFVTEAEGDSTTIKISRGFSTEWEVLEPEIDYALSEADFKTITFTQIPQESDKIYVLHKGDATYNLVPSDNSVGPNQLSQNLRNFTLDKFTGDNVEDTFTLSTAPVSGKAIVVTVDGVVKDWKDEDISGNTGDYYVDGTDLIFHTAPANSTKIRVLHLGFSTVSRRAALSPSQLGTVADGSITTNKLATSSVTESKIATGGISATKLASDSVITSKILADNVTSAKILLDNDTSIRGKNTSGTAKDLIKNNASDNTEVLSENGVELTAGARKLTYESGALTPDTTNDSDLGSSSKKFKDAHLAGAVNAATISTSGNATIGGTISSSTITTINSNITALQAEANPIGSVIDYAGASDPAGSKWLICDGREISRSTYASLFAISNTLYGSGNGTTTFNIPDCRGRSTLGKTASGTASTLGDTGGSLEHTHSNPAHSHNIAHTHGVPAHYHGVTGNGATIAISVNTGSTHTHNISHSHNYTGNTGIAFAAISVDSGGAHSHSTNYDSNSTLRDGSLGTGSANITSGGGGYRKDTLTITSGGGHTHSASDSGHYHSISLTTASQSTSSTNSGTADGAHTHPNSGFSGSVGHVTSGNNGDSTLTTASQSTSSSATDGSTTSGASSHAYIVFNKIIRVL